MVELRERENSLNCLVTVGSRPMRFMHWKTVQRRGPKHVRREEALVLRVKTGKLEGDLWF